MAKNLKLVFFLTALALGVPSCEVVLWQEPAPADTSLLRLPEWTPDASTLTQLPGNTLATLQGTARPSGLARYAGSTPGDWATLKTARIRWEDGTQVHVGFTITPDTTPDTWPQRYVVTLEIPLRPGNTWFETLLEDTWGYSTPWKKITLN